MGFSGKNWFICIAIPDIVVMGFVIKPVISPTYQRKLEAQKPVISSIPVLRTELHVSAIILNLKVALKSCDIVFQ